MTDKVMTALCSAIVEQAVEDYRELRRKGKEYRGSDMTGNYSICEIEHFLTGKWGELVLRGMKSRIDGFTIMHQLKTEQI